MNQLNFFSDYLYMYTDYYILYNKTHAHVFINILRYQCIKIVVIMNK